MDTNSQAWKQLQGRFAIPAATEAALKHATIDRDEALVFIEALHEVDYSIKLALERIGPVLAQSVDGAQIERVLSDAHSLLQHLTKKPPTPQRY